MLLVVCTGNLFIVFTVYSLSMEKGSERDGLFHFDLREFLPFLVSVRKRSFRKARLTLICDSENSMGSSILISGVIEVDGRNKSNYSKPRILF